MNSHTLLSSQDKLISDITSSFAENDFLVMSGERSSGKTTIAISLIEKLKDFNQCFLPIPAHYDPLEIKTKIINQIFGNVFINYDNSLFTIFSSVKLEETAKKNVIVLDDANFLNTNILLDIFSLSKIQNLQIKVLFILNKKYLSSFNKKCTKIYGQNLNSFMVQPLTLSERNTMYISLMYLANVDRSVSDNIITKHLAKQSGKPLEVVSLVQNVIHNPYSLSNKKKYLAVKLTLSAVSVFAVLLVVKVFAPVSRDLSFIEDLKQDFKSKVSVAQNSILMTTESSKNSSDANEASAVPDTIDSSDQFNLRKVDVNDVKLINKKPEENPDDTVYQDSSSAAYVERELISGSRSGYVIQIASFKDIDKIFSFRENTSMDLSKISFVRSKGRYIVIYRSAKDRKTALEIANKYLPPKSFWVRSWGSVMSSKSYIIEFK